VRSEEYSEVRREVSEWRQDELHLRGEISRLKNLYQKAADDLYEAQYVLIPDLERLSNRHKRLAELRALLLKEDRRQMAIEKASMEDTLDQVTQQARERSAEVLEVKRSHDSEVRNLRYQLEKHSAVIGGVRELAVAHEYSKVVGFFRLNGY